MTEDGQKCTFPFKHEGNVYHRCLVRNSVAWCATDADPKLVLAENNYKNWGYCNPDCPGSKATLLDFSTFNIKPLNVLCLLNKVNFV